MFPEKYASLTLDGDVLPRDQGLEKGGNEIAPSPILSDLAPMERPVMVTGADRILTPKDDVLAFDNNLLYAARVLAVLNDCETGSVTCDTPIPYDQTRFVCC